MKKSTDIFKNIIVNKPAFYLNPDSYARYIKFLSRITYPIAKVYKLNYNDIKSEFDSKYILTIIWNLDRPIKIQSKIRISRFIKGFYNSGERQWRRYGIDILLGNDVPATLIDIGANVGEVSYFACKNGVEKVIAVEPDPIAMECLEFNLENTNVILDGRPLNSAIEDVTFYLKPDSADSSLFKPAGEFREINLQAITLDALFESYKIDSKTLIKMDAEGFEDEVIEGASELIASCRPVILFENNPPKNQISNRRRFWETLDKYDFIVMNDGVKAEFDANMRYENVFAIPHEKLKLIKL